MTTSLSKKIRIVDKKLLEFIKRLPCIACSNHNADEARAYIMEVTDESPVISDPDHVSTKGSGGDDVPENVMPLCRKHHTMKGAKGVKYMAENYPSYKKWLITAGRLELLDV